MPRIHFQQQLVALKDKLLAMAALSQQALEFSVEAYLSRDVGLSNHVQEIEAAINAAETSVDDRPAVHPVGDQDQWRFGAHWRSVDQHCGSDDCAGGAAGYLAAGRHQDYGQQGGDHDPACYSGAA